jgi:hypothetical protein
MHAMRSIARADHHQALSDHQPDRNSWQRRLPVWRHVKTDFPRQNGGMRLGLVGTLARSTDRIRGQRHAMRVEAHAFVIRKPTDESPEGFGLAWQTLAPRRMTLGGLLLGDAFVRCWVRVLRAARSYA